MQINANNIVIPSNTSQELFTHAAADNWNRTTDAMKGEHLNIWSHTKQNRRIHKKSLIVEK